MKFIIFFITILILSISTVGSLNFIFDETYFADLLSKKITIETDNRRITSPLIIKKFKPKCAIIGTSRIGRGMSSDNKFIKTHKCLNLYLNAANIDEINLIIKLLIRSEVEKVFIGLDFFSFNKNYEILKYQGNLNKYDYLVDNTFFRLITNFERLISLRNLKKIFLDGRTAKIEYSENINNFYEKTFDVTNNQRIDVSLVDDRFIKSKALRSYFDKNAEGHGLGNFELNEKGLENFIKLLGKLNESKVETKLFFSPVHVYLYEGILKYHKNSYIEIIGKIATKSNLKNIYVYDFSGFNNITNGANLSKNFVNGYYFDLGHYSSEVGDLIINKFYNDNEKFGTLITNFQIKNFSKKIDQNRKEWKKNNKRDYMIVRDVLSCENNHCVEKIILKYFQLNYNIDQVNLHKSSENTEKEVLVPAGYFYFGLKDEHRTINDSKYEYIYLDDYFIDRYEISNEDFIKYSKNNQLVEKINNFDKKIPVTGISYLEAENYCNNIGKRLPTEAEWEKALKFSYYTRYPWGNSFPTCERINFNGEKSIGCGKKIRNKDITKYGNLTINSKLKENGKSYLDIYNLSGNVWEFVKSSDSDAITKGGSWSSELIKVHSASRYIVSKNSSLSHIGFRCARTN